MSLLAVRPDLASICNAAGGNNLITAFSNASSYLYRFDGTYIGSRDRQSNFGLYGDPTVTLSTNSLNWVYNSTLVQTFTVTSNHSSWKFTSSSSASGFTVGVYDPSNTTYLGGFNTSQLYPTGATVRVNPNAINNGSSDNYCYLYCGTWNDLNIVGACMTGDQAHVGTLAWYFESDDNSVPSITNTSATNFVPGQNPVTVYYTPSGMANSPCTNWVTIIVPGHLPYPSLGETSISPCRNGVAAHATISLSEYISSETYYINIQDNNA